MNSSKQILHLLSLILGLVGLIGCVAAIVGTWSVKGQLNRLTGNVFEAADNSLAVARQRVAQTQDRVSGLKITTEAIERGFKNWTKTEARECLTSRLEIEEKAQRLASGLDQADHWLALTESSVQLVQQTLEVASSLGVRVQTEPADRLLEEIVSLRRQLTQTIEPVERIHERATEGGIENLGADRIDQFVQVTVRVMATVTSIDFRLDMLGDRLTEIQTKTRSAKAKATWWIRTRTIGIALLIGWMAAGQGSLCYLGWHGFRDRHSVSTGDSGACQSQSAGTR